MFRATAGDDAHNPHGDSVDLEALEAHADTSLTSGRALFVFLEFLGLFRCPGFSSCTDSRNLFKSRKRKKLLIQLRKTSHDPFLTSKRCQATHPPGDVHSAPSCAIDFTECRESKSSVLSHALLFEKKGDPQVKQDVISAIVSTRSKQRGR